MTVRAIFLLVMILGLPQLATAQAAEGGPQEVRPAHQTDGHGREFLERRTHGNQDALQTLSGEQDRHTEQQRC